VRTHVGLPQRTLNYDAVGATSVAASATSRPTGYRLYERTVRIGAGSTRWEFASTAVLHWGVKTRSGFTVLAENRAIGEPLAVQVDQRYWLIAHFGPFRIREPIEVVAVIDEPNRAGFAYGTLAGHPVSGEEAFIVDRHADGSVSFTLRSVSRRSTGIWRSAYPVVALAQRCYRRRYLRALSGPL
jgi:uncharacterized protein (UPF0548 family)